MRSRTAFALALGSVASAAVGAGLVACFDLFHSTTGIQTACELDAQACVDAGPSTDAGATDFCAWSSDEARGYAARACAWLGACETPLGGNAFGSCMFDALLAYDCAANPAHPVRGEAHALWDCLWQVKSCGDVDRCVFPQGVPQCMSPGDYTYCAPKNPEVRVECIDGGRAVGDDCAFRGQTCAAGAAMGFCAGANADAGGLDCQTMLGCTGNYRYLHFCSGKVDVGIDCASNGAQKCAGYPNSGLAQWVACLPQGDAGCPPGTSVSCSNGYATSCPLGIVESINCTELLQVPDASCMPGALTPPFDWSSPCTVMPPECTSETCSGTRADTLTGCARGAPFTTSCSTQGLGPCHMVTTDVGSAMHAACAPPSP